MQKKEIAENKIEAPNFEATSDGKRIFTPKQWLERFRQYIKRKHKMDIAELIRGAEITQTGWSGKDAEIQEDFFWESVPKPYTKRHERNTKQNSTK